MFNIDITQLSEFDYKNVKIIKKRLYKSISRPSFQPMTKC